MTLPNGTIPAMVTPYLPTGEIDFPSVARMLAFFQAAGCAGVVVAGTNGEGPSLASVEKRDLVRESVLLANGMPILLGIATHSLSEANWLAKQASKAGAAGLLVMPPSYFDASDEALASWFLSLLNDSQIPVLIYNFPKYNGFPLSLPLLARLSDHPRFAGLKDSSGEVGNLSSYRNVLQGHHRLFVGDETLLITALENGWSGTISGAANVVPQWLSQIVQEWHAQGLRESSRAKFALLGPVLEAIRKHLQPQTHKQVLRHWGVIEHDDVRLPLEALANGEVGNLLGVLESTLGLSKGKLGILAH